MLSKIRQIKGKYHRNSLICGIKNQDRPINTKNKLIVAKGEMDAGEGWTKRSEVGETGFQLRNE